MNERLFENGIVYGTNSKYSSTISSAIHIQNKLTLLICGLKIKPSDLSFRFNIKITVLTLGK